MLHRFTSRRSALLAGAALAATLAAVPAQAQTKTPIKIGFAQCLAMIPGVSRSGASIVAAMLLGADRRSAAEFSFFLAIPTMVGAFAYDLYKSRADMTIDHLGIVAIGFVVSFITAIWKRWLRMLRPIALAM